MVTECDIKAEDLAREANDQLRREKVESLVAPKDEMLARVNPVARVRTAVHGAARVLKGSSHWVSRKSDRAQGAAKDRHNVMHMYLAPERSACSTIANLMAGL